ncbi:Diuretic hormone receptor [Orchesella cincta]|uniref:Diuretic hormone receptor n=1 Tax=Orchesella cincta TaxID=48709 RepID=A0A1D2MRN4_ORCCI|nr:Diuretic hormone receptor [Orchesella cincta]
MYSNVASSFITGFVSPIPPFSTDDDVINRRDSTESSTQESVNSNEEGVSRSRIKAICESLFLATSANASHTYHHSNLAAHHNQDTSSGKGGAASWDEDTSNEYSLGRELSKSNSSNYRHHPEGYHSNSAGASGVANNYNGVAGETGHGSLSSDSNYDGAFCPVDWDDILCWPRTAAGEIAQLPCFDILHGVSYNSSGTAERLCLEDGVWNKTEYSGCKPFPHQALNITTDTGNLDITTGIYLFGYSVSLIALIIAAVIFISFKELRCLRNTIHSHLMVTYVLADALWVLGVVSSGSSDQRAREKVKKLKANFGGLFFVQGGKEKHTTHATCITFVLLHYFHLTNFFWMFVEGKSKSPVSKIKENCRVMMLSLSVCVGGPNFHDGKYPTKNLLLDRMGFAVSNRTSLVNIKMGDNEHPVWWSNWKNDSGKCHRSDEPKICNWVSNLINLFLLFFKQMAELELNTVVCPWIHANQYDWIYMASALIVLAANLVFLLQIMWVLITKLRSATSQETQQSRKAAKALVVLMPLLGITYVLFLINPKKWSAFEHTRAFLLSTQGFLVSLLYCFLNAEVRSAIRHRWNRMGGFGPEWKCCCCCDSSAQSNVQNLRDWSPRSRTESIR